MNYMDAILHNQIAIQPLMDTAGKFLNINLSGFDSSDTEVSIINYEGTKVHRAKANGFSNLKIDTKNLPKGFYLLQVTNDEGVLNKKLIID